jgi:hypothetical protein
MIIKKLPDNVMIVLTLGLLMLCVAGIIVGGYIHGDMHFAKVLEHLKK